MVQEMFPDRKMDNVRSYNPWTVMRYAKTDRRGAFLGLKPSGRAWLIKELGKVEGGLDGITLTEVK